MDEPSGTGLGGFIKNLFQRKPESDIEDMIMEAEDDGELGKEDASMLLNILSLRDYYVTDLMTPRTDIVCAEINNSFEAIADTMITSGHTRLPIYRDSRDQLIGFIHIKDMLKVFINPSKRPDNIIPLLRPLLFVVETTSVKNLLFEFKTKKNHVAIVLDEYGGTEGMVTLEDILEAIVGEIEDITDPPKPAEIMHINDTTMRVSAKIHLDDFAEISNIILKSENVDTIGGWICEQTGRVPKTGEVFIFDNKKYFIKEANHKQIQWIIITKLDTDAPNKNE